MSNGHDCSGETRLSSPLEALLSASFIYRAENNTASGRESTVSGGSNNTASGLASSISGGQNNIVTPTGFLGTVSGGVGVTVSTPGGHQ